MPFGRARNRLESLGIYRRTTEVTFNYLSGLESLREFGRIVVEALVELDLSTLGCIVPELELY